MNGKYRPGADNITSLRQGIEMIEMLEDPIYTGTPDRVRIGGIGSQFRHCIDFYTCLLRGVDDGTIDYNCRERDSRVETDRAHAIDCMKRISEKLQTISLETASRKVSVRRDPVEIRDGGPEAYESTLGRELQFLLSHTVHHYALIVALLELQHVDLDAGFSSFGVAPSTLRYWEKTGTVAG
jgi:hypothetical protein